MPKVTIEGKGGGGGRRLSRPEFGRGDDRANAEWMNADWDSVRRTQYADANYIDANMNLQAKNLRTEADYINKDHEMRARNARAEAEFYNASHDQQLKNIRVEAQYINVDHDLRVKNTRAEATYFNQEHDLKLKNARTEAYYIERDRTLAERVRRKEYENAYAEANYINRNMDIAAGQRRALDGGNLSAENKKFDDDYRMAWYMNRDMNAATGGGGGKRQYLPFFGALGLGNTGELIGELAGSAIGGLSGGIAGYLAAKTVEELAMAPQKIASLERSGLASAQPYIDLKKSSYAAGRAGNGFSGDDLFRSFFPGFYEMPPWMATAGIGPTGAMSAMQGFGIAPHSSAQGVDIARSLSMLQFLPGLSGMDTAPIMNTLGKYGMISPDAAGITNGGAELSHIMENAIERGMNRAEVLRSIDTAISAAARGGGIGQSAGGLADFLYRFSSMPGGMTGETGLHAMEGVQGAMSSVGSNAIRTMMTGTAAVGRYNTEDKLKSFLNKDNPSFYEKLAGSSVGRAALDNYFSAVKTGDMYGASIWLRELTVGNPAAQADLLSQPGFLSGPGYMKDIEGANLTGMTPTEYIASQINPGAALGAIPSHIGSDLALRGYVSPGGGGGGAEARMSGSNQYKLDAYDPRQTDEYRAALLRQGVAPQLVDTVLAAAQKHGFDPRVYGAILRNESAGGTDPHTTLGGAYGLTGIQNPAQISASSGKAMPTSPEMSIEEGAQIIEENMRAPGATLRSVVQGYRGPDMNESYWQKFSAGLVAGGYGGDGSAQTDLYKLGASVDQASMQSAATSFHEMATIVPEVNSALAALVKAFKNAAIDFSALAATNKSTPFSYEGLARMGAGH